MSQGARPVISMGDYLADQHDKNAVADRRPVARTPSELVGPGIRPFTVRITDFNNTLATFDGFFSSAAGAANAPTAGDAYIGFVSSDAEIGGVQRFTNITTESLWQRVFRRAPGDAASITWGSWIKTSGI